MPVAYVDARALRNEGVARIVKSLRVLGVAVVERELAVGFLHVPGLERRYTFELASASRLPRLAKTKWFSNTLEKLANVEGAGILIVEGWPGKTSLELTRTLLEVQEAGVQIVLSPNRKWTIDYLAAKVKGAYKKRYSYRALRNGPPKDADARQRALYLAEGLGPKIGKALLLRFGGFEGLAAATIDEIAETRVDGRRIGYARAEKIYEILHARVDTSKLERLLAEA